MTPLEAAHAGATLATIAVLVAVGHWVYRNHDDSAATAFVALIGVCVGWSALVGLRLLVPWEGMVALFQFQQVFSWAIPALWFVFALHYAGREYLLTRRWKAVVAAGYAVPAGLALTNHFHWLVWAEYRLVEDPFPVLRSDPTTLYFVQFALVYVFVLAAYAVLVELFVSAGRRSRKQLLLVLFAAVPSTVLNVSEQFGMMPVPGFDYTVFGTGFFAVVTGVALFHYRLFDVAPLARDAVLGATRESILVVDTRGRVVDYNDAAIDVFPGLDAAYGSPVRTTAPGLFDDGEGAAADDPRAVRSATRFDPGAIPDEVMLHRDGERRTYGVGVSMVQRGGTARGYVVVLRDLSEVERYARRLEQQTRQLDRFASTVSHDLRNPLGVAKGMAEQLRHGDADPAYVDELETALDRMDTLIDDALTLAREGQAVEDREVVSLSWIGKQAWETSDTGDATLRVDVDGTQVYADPDRLQRVFENLFRNSVEHGSTSNRTGSGDAAEHGSTSNRTGSGDAVEHAPGDATVRIGTHEDGFFVEDDGPGIPEGKRDQVFDQGYTTTEEGTGLGLPIVRSIAEAHGWGVAVEEGSDGGARFVFSGVEHVPSGDDPASSSRAPG